MRTLHAYDLPVVSIADTFKHFQPTIFEHLYYYTASANMSALVKLDDGGYHAQTGTWERYSSIKILMDRLRTTCRRARIQSPITSAFQAVYIEDVAWEKETCIQGSITAVDVPIPSVSTDTGVPSS